MAIQQSWFVYKTTNLVNGKFYIGVHKGAEQDAYLGSGVHLRRALKYHGRENFIREVVLVCEDADSAYELEELIVDTNFVKRFDTYNLALGGRGAGGMGASEETKALMRKPKTIEHRQAMSTGRIGRQLSETHCAAISQGQIGKKMSDETRAKMSQTRSGRTHTIIECPYCGKTGGAPAMKQWHFDNCKLLEEE